MSGSSKIIILFLICLLMPALVWAQEAPQEEPRVLVVYYSRTGHNVQVAEKLAKKFNAKLERLKDQHKRTGPAGYLSAGKDAISQKTTLLDPLIHNPQDFEIILIGGPSWIGNTTPAVRTFVMQNDLTAKKIGLFGTCHLSGVEHAIEEVALLISPDKRRKFPSLPLREKELKDDILQNKIDVFYQAVMELKQP